MSSANPLVHAVSNPPREPRRRPHAAEPGRRYNAGPIAALRPARERYLAACLDGDRHAALAAVRDALRTHVQHDVYVDVVQEAMYELGRRREAYAVGVADEHRATDVTRCVLAELYGHAAARDAATRTATRTGMPAGTRIGTRTAVVTGVEGEYHQVGANLVADTLEACGWHVGYLGTNLPHETVLEIVDRMRPELVGIAVTMHANLCRVRELAGDIRRRAAHASPRIVVGGGAFRDQPALWRQTGADEYVAELRALGEG